MSVSIETHLESDGKKAHVDTLQVDVLALSFVLSRSLEGVDLQEQLLVRLLVVLRLHELRALVQVASVALLEFGFEFRFGFLERLHVDLRLARLDLLRHARE